MNRYVRAGLVKDAQTGKRVFVAVQNHREGRALMREIEAGQPEGMSLACRANGAERIEFANGGSIRLLCRAAGDSMRGAVADVLFVEGWDDIPAATRADLIAATATGELIRA